MKYPALVMDSQKLKTNAQALLKLCNENEVGICVVTKCICANPEMVDVLYSAGIREFADSRIENLIKINYKDCVKWLLRLPMQSEAEEVVKYADISLNSELETLKMLSAAVVKLGKNHKVILMIDVGDLREGIWPDNATDMAGEIISLPGIELYGLGTNLNCYGGIIPTSENLGIVCKIAEEIEEKFGVKLKLISGGNSGSIHMLTSKKMPERVNNIRLGEAVLFGWETSYQGNIEGCLQDVFRLHAEIIELKEKPSVPIGEAGLNAFGEKTVYADKGLMKRAIVACGRQDVYYEKLELVDKKAEIIGSSSDHMIIDVTQSDRNYRVGDIIEFKTSYGSLLSLSTSEYVHKYCVNN